MPIVIGAKRESDFSDRVKKRIALLARREPRANVAMVTHNVNIAALTLIVVGALNWGLWGLFQLDLVAALFGGNTSLLSRTVYSLVGLAGLYGLTLFSPLMSRTHDRVAA